MVGVRKYMHFMAFPATFCTAAYERILFTKHSSGTAPFVAQSQSRVECRTSTVALEDVHRCVRSRQNATQQKPHFVRISAVADLVHCVMPFRSMRRSKQRANIDCGAG